jgi:hypothetical protein
MPVTCPTGPRDAPVLPSLLILLFLSLLSLVIPQLPVTEPTRYICGNVGARRRERMDWREEVRGVQQAVAAGLVTSREGGEQRKESTRAFPMDQYDTGVCPAAAAKDPLDLFLCRRVCNAQECYKSPVSPSKEPYFFPKRALPTRARLTFPITP